MNDLLKINNLSVSFNVDNKVYQAVKNISLNIAQGEALKGKKYIHDFPRTYDIFKSFA